MPQFRLSAAVSSRFKLFSELCAMAVLSAPRRAIAMGSLLLTLLLAAGTVTAGAQTVMNVALTPSDSLINSAFGQSVAIGGDTMVMGATATPAGGGQPQGDAYVFTKSGSTWTQTAILPNPYDSSLQGPSADGYGNSVAISGDGDTIVVGAPQLTSSTADNYQGAVFVYTLSGSTWTQQAELVAGYKDFGWSVAISGDGGTIAVGNINNLANTPNAGAVFVYTLSGSTWTQQAELISSDGKADDFLGSSVAISGGTIVTGAPGHSPSGAAYVFTGSGSSWTQAAELFDPAPVNSVSPNGSFGNSVAIDGGTILVGADGQSFGTNYGVGAVFVYTGSGSDWTEQAQLTDPAMSTSSEFGNSVAVNGGTIVVGEPSRSPGGAAYVYTGSGPSWMYQEELLDSPSEGMLGSSVGVSGDMIAVSAPSAGTVGIVYVGVLSPISLTSPSASSITYGQEATELSATITPAEGSPTGTVLFVNGGSTSGGIFYGGGTSISSGNYVLGSQVLGAAEVSSGEAETSQVLMPESYNLQAYYVGDGNLYLPVYSTVTDYTVSPATVTFSLPSSVQSIQGTGSSFQASLTGYSTAVGVQPPTGTISYTLLNSTGMVTSGSSALSGGAAIIPVLSSLAAGSYTYQLTYSGDSNYNAISTPSAVPLIVAGGAAQLVVSGYPVTAYAGMANTGTVTAYDALGDVAIGFNGGVNVITSESTTPIPATLQNGVGMFSASFATAATGQSITASSTGLVSVSETGITVNALPSYVVNTANDDATGVATNCTSSPEGTCTLRDALVAANLAGGGAISFSTTAFATTNAASVNTIYLCESGGIAVGGCAGTLTVTPNTTITGRSGAVNGTTSNLVTISGAGGYFPIFTVGSSVTGATIANLNLTNGYADAGGAILNAGTLVVTGSTFTANAATGGAISNSGTLTVAGSTFTTNTAPGGAGGAIDNSGLLTVTNSTFNGNSSSESGGAITNSSTLTVTNSTFTTNAVDDSGGAIQNASTGTLMLTNNILAGNTQPEGGALYNNGGTMEESYNVFYNNSNGDFVSTNTASLSGTDVTGQNTMLSTLGSYGGGTQTILPLPGSSALCAGTRTKTTYGITPPITDQRGNPADALCGSGTMDAGAAQTNYSLAFAVQPASSPQSGQIISGYPTVQLQDNNAAINLSGANLSATLAQGTLSGTTNATTNSAGLAIFNGLIATSASGLSGDTLTVTAVIDGTTNISSTSAEFSVLSTSITLLPATIAAGQIGVAYSQQISASGGSGPYVYSYSGVMPSGLSLSSTGLISGIPTQGGSFSIKVIATDSSSDTGSQIYTLTIGAPSISVSSRTLTAGTYGSAYTASIAASGGTAPYSYALASGSSLPAGLTLNASTGLIGGTPSAAVTGQSFSIVATDSSTGAGPYSGTGTYQLSISKALLTVTANSNTIAYGQTIPAYTASYSGYVNNDTASTAFTGTPSLTTTPASPVNVGTYPVTAATGTLTSANYSFSYVNGAVTIGKATLTVTASSPTVTYGAVVPAITPSYSGFLNGDTANVLTTVPSCTTAYVTSSAVGSSSSTSCSGATAVNYSFSYVNGAVTVGKAMLTVTASSPTVAYGAVVPAITPSYSGWVGTDTASVLTATPTCSSTYTTTSTVGSHYPSNCTGAAAANYSILYVAGSVTVNQATPTVTWAAPSAITSGTALSSAQLDATASVPGTLVYSPAAGTVPGVGTQTLTASFTPTDTTDYTTATASVLLTVNAGPADYVPTLGTLSPVYTTAGGATFTLTLTGTNFTSGDTAYWGSTPLSTTYVSATQLTASVSASLIASASVVSIAVVNSFGSSTTLEFIVNPPYSPNLPTISIATATVSAGGTASYTVTVPFPSSVSSLSLVCLNLPAGANCSYSSSTGTINIVTSSATPSGTHTVTLVFTDATSASLAGMMLPILLLPLYRARKRLSKFGVWIAGCMAFLLLAGSMALSGCGSPVSADNQQTQQLVYATNVTMTVK